MIKLFFMGSTERRARFARALGALFMTLLACGALSAQEETADKATVRADAESVLMFNQYLYYGTFERPKALAFDAAHNEVYLADSTSGRIAAFRPDGFELFSFVSKQHLKDPVRIAVTPGGDLAVIQGDRTDIRLFNYRGVYKGLVQLPPVEHKRLIGAVAYDAEGNLYVADNGSSEVFVYTPQGRLKLQFGNHGRDEGQFQSIGGIVVAKNGDICVLEQQGLAIQIFDHQGNFIRGWGKHEMGASNFSLPSGIALDSRGRIYASDELRHQVKIFTPEGALLGLIGGLGDGPGRLSFPTDVVVGEQDRIYVSERFTQRVQVFATHDVAADE